MYVIHIASELAPVAKIGGLADVISGLSRQLSLSGHDVDIIIPKYDCMDSDSVQDLEIVYQNMRSYYQGAWHANTIWVGWVGNIKIYFIDAHHPKYFFARGCIYGCEDDLDRFLYFSRAAMEFLYKENKVPDVLHIHDWQSAAIALLARDLYQDWGYKIPRIVFTIHNLAYQGKCLPSDLSKIGLDGYPYLVPDKLQDRFTPHDLNLLKGAVVYSNAVTTVSPSYAQEILNPGRDEGLGEILNNHKEKLVGILNGIDGAYWNPETDPLLPANFSSREVPLDQQDRKTIDKKAFIKKVLREHLSLEELHRPIIGCIARLVPQKGLDLIKHSIFRTLEMGGQFVFLGSGPIPSINSEFHQIKHQFADHPHVHLILQQDEKLAHWMYGGCDMMIIPSIFEPCGLVQMISLRYGTVPIVHKTGGLADTIHDIDYSDLPEDQRNGYSFETPDNEGVNSALDRAIRKWFDNPDQWRKLMICCMNMDYSWKSSVDKYLELYRIESN